MIVMLRVSSPYNRIISASLLFALLGTWAACLMFCSEALPRHEDSWAESTTAFSGASDCFDSDCLKGCSIDKPPVTLQERQNVSVPVLLSKGKAFSIFQPNAIPAEIPAFGTDLHEPPNIIFRRFLRLQNFRI